MKYFVFYFAIIFSLPALYRPSEVHIADAVSAANGGSSVSLFPKVQTISQNPSGLMLTGFRKFTIGVDGREFLNKILLNSRKVSINSLPYAALTIPWKERLATGVMFYTDFVHSNPTTDFFRYNSELIISIKLFDQLVAGMSSGLSTGVEALRYTGYGYTGSLSLFYKNKNINFGFLYRNSSPLYYKINAMGYPLKEIFPGIMKAGLTYTHPKFSITTDFEKIFWHHSRYIENGLDLTPPIQADKYFYIHPHISAAFPFHLYTDVTIRSGFFTADNFDYDGSSRRIFYYTIGSGLPLGTTIWSTPIQLNVAWVSSWIFSLLIKDNLQQEQFYALVALSI